LSAAKGELDYLGFETMAEATLSAAQVRMRRDPTFPGYELALKKKAPLLALEMTCIARGAAPVSQ